MHHFREKELSLVRMEEEIKRQKEVSQLRDEVSKERERERESIHFSAVGAFISSEVVSVTARF